MKRFIRRILISFALLLFCAASLVCGISYHVFSSMVHRISYKPERMAMILQERVRLKLDSQAREISFATQDGVRIAGVLFIRPGAQRNILICHGHKSAKEMTRPLVDMFPHDNILIFDFRAHGQSEGDLTTFGYNEHFEVQGAVQFLKLCPETMDLPVYGVGVSMGAASLLHAAANGVSFEALILDSSFASLKAAIGDAFSSRTGLPSFLFKNIVVWFFEREAGFPLAAFNPCEEIARVTCPVFIIHSMDDSVVSVHQAQKLYECARGKKVLWLAEHAYHGRMSKELGQEYARRATEFFGSIAD